MPPMTPKMLNSRKEENCISITAERKYYKVGQTWIKRCLRPSEWQINPYNGNYMVPRLWKERIWNEAASLKFIAEKTTIPVPKVHCCFEDDEAVYLITEYIEGVGMNELEPEQRKEVENEVEGYLKEMSNLTSNRWGGPTDIVVPPYRLMVKPGPLEWVMKPREKDDLVFCHNDLSTYNIIVDPETLKIKAVIDWEYAGFFPPEFESMFFKRVGPSVALEGEHNDEDELYPVLTQNRA